jgi:hypothetical protein
LDLITAVAIFPPKQVAGPKFKESETGEKGYSCEAFERPLNRKKKPPGGGL